MGSLQKTREGRKKKHLDNEK